jgi:alkylation response protein AidB-like acyl-CoA dehydrogenase
MTDTNVQDSAISVEDFRQRARAWLEANLEKRSPEQGVSPPIRRGRTPEAMAVERAIQKRLYEGGFAGITWPKEYGGQGLTPAHERAFNEEASPYRMPDLGAAGSVTFEMCGPTMLVHASPEFLHRHVPSMLAGDELWAEFFSEPVAGSDLAGIQSRATKDGDRWILNGSKIWSSGAYYADYGMCLARTNWDVPKHRGLTWFAVKTDKPGVTVQPIRQINGDAEFCQEFFDDVELSDEDVIGDVDEGWSAARTMLIYERGGGERAGVAAVRHSRRLAPDLVELARRLHRDGDPTVRQLIARAHINDWVRSELLTRVAQLTRAGAADPSGIAAYGKLASGIYSAERARIGMEIGRGAAVAWSDDSSDGANASANYLNGRMSGIAGGTNEVQRNGIGERVLGLPREPSFDTDRPFSEVVRRAARWTGSTS